MGLLLLAVVAAVAIGLLLTPGIGLIGLIPLAAAVVIGGWLVLSRAAGMSLTGALRRTRNVEHLGPGGPDDPDRSR
jgi:hypothetical protein